MSNEVIGLRPGLAPGGKGTARDVSREGIKST